MSITNRLLLPVLVFAICLSKPAQAGGPVTSGQTVAGTLAGPTFTEAWTFSGSVGQRVVFAAVTTGGLVNTNINLKAPGGALESTSGSQDRLDVTLLATGTYSVEITDVGLNDAGTYAMTFLNVSAGPLTSAGDTDGGPIASSTLVSGSTAVGDLDAFTFTGTINDRILFNAMETGGVGYNTTMYIYDPTGAAFTNTLGANQFDFKLTATGTWTILVEDLGNDTPGNYTVSLLNVTAGPLTNGSDPDGGPIASNEIKIGSFSSGLDMDAFTITGNVGDVVLFAGIATGGGSHNTQLTFYPPGGGAAQLNGTSDREEFQLTASGTWTLVIYDNGLNDAGTYQLSYLNVTSGPLTTPGDLDGGPIASSEIRSGSSVSGDFDAFTISGTLNDRILFNAVETGGVGYNTVMYIYGPTGTAVTNTLGANQIDFKLTATGTWTFVVEDTGNDTPGNYTVSFLNVTSGPLTNGTDPDGGPIASNEVRTGSFSSGLDMDAWTFNATNGDVVLFSGLATGLGSHNTQLVLYPPGGGPSVLNGTSDRQEIQLAASGTWTLVIYDNGLNDPGTYQLSYLNLTSGPLTTPGDPDGGPIASSEIRSGSSVSGDFDAFTFPGTINDRILFNAVETGGSGYNTTIYVYGPTGISIANTLGNNLLDLKLTATGTWTVVVEDVGNDTPGNYAASLLNVTAGPLTSGADPDGGPIGSNEIKAGSFSTGVDMDAFTFFGNAGDAILFTAQATGAGTHDTQIAIYPPAGAASVRGTSSDRNELALTATGLWTIVVSDFGFNDAGAYQLSFLNLTAGEFTRGTDTGGGPITSNDIRQSATDTPGDFDGYQFLGTKGDRIVITAAETGGVGYNTNVLLYPPGGVAATTTLGGNRLEYQLTATGAWTIVVEAVGNVTTGSYNLCFMNVTGGPLFSNGSDGGQIDTGVPLNGSMGQVADLDGYTFFGAAGQTANISCVVNSGAMNSQISLYPPGGGGPLVSTGNDIVNQLLSVTGYYTILIEDLGDDQAGNYTITLNGTGAISGTPPDPTALPDGKRALLLPASPSPFRQNTLMAFRLGVAGDVELRVFDAAGRLVRTLVSATLSAGRHEVAWDGRDEQGQGVGSGVYYLRMRAAGEDIRQKVVRVL